jgi:MFS family permease
MKYYDMIFMNNKLTTNIYYPMWLLLATFYGFQYFMRVTPCIIGDSLRDEFCLSAQQFSLFSALFLYGYGFCQIPTGYFLDTKGFRKTMSISIFLCAMGSLLFFISDNLWIKYISRLIMGIGASGGLIAPLKLVGDKIADGKKGLFNGLTLAIGTAGALLAGNSLANCMDNMGSLNSGILISLIGIALSILLFIFFPKQPEKNKTIERTFFIANLKLAVKSKKLFLYAFLTFGCFAPLAVLVDSWGTAFLMAKVNINNQEASNFISFVFFGLFTGSFLVPTFFEKKRKIHFGIQSIFFITIVFFASLIFFNTQSFAVIKSILFGLGFLASAEILCFTAASNMSTEHLRGISLGVVNTINMVGSGFLQQCIGFFIDLFWDKQVSASGVPIYSYETYQKAFCVILAIYILCFVLSICCLKKDSDLIIKV